MQPLARWGGVPVLGVRDVHLWPLPLHGAGALASSFLPLLSPDEHRRAERLRDPLHAARFVVARGAVRVVLGAYHGLPPAALHFQYGADGKPGLGAEDAPRFNVSHSEDLALLAVSRTRELGVDVERLRAVDGSDDIVRGFFTARERQTLARRGRGRRARTFLRWWTRKEAYLKAIGRGLALPLHELDVSRGAARSMAAALPAASDGAGWSMRDLRPSREHVGALVVAGTGWRLTRLPPCAPAVLLPR